MFKLLKFSTGKAKILMIFSLCMIFCQAIFDIMQPIILMQITNFTLNTSSTDWSMYWLLIGLMFIFAFCSLITGIVGSFCGSKSSLLVSKNIREAIFSKTQSLSYIDIDKITASSLVTRITNDVQKFQITLQMIITMLIKAPFLLIGGLVISFLINWQMGMIVIVVIFILVASISFIALKGIPTFDKAQKNMDENNKIMRENILGMRVVKTFCLEEIQQKRFAVASDDFRKNNTKGQTLFSLLMPIISATFQGTIAIILLVGGLISRTNGDGNFVSKIYIMVNILFLVLSAVIIALMVIINMSRSKPSRKRIQEILDIQPSITNPVNPIEIKSNLDISFKNVNFKYTEDAEEYVLHNINLKIKHGQFIGIVGGTGSGKTSLISLIPRLYDLQEGSVSIGGVDVRNASLEQIRNNVGIVIQENILFSGTIKSNLLYGNQNATTEDLDVASKTACAFEFINSLKTKYDSVVEQRGRNFSGGQRQRLSIARTIVKKPNILILDDSTSALDLATEAALQKNLKNDMNDCTKIIVAQRISAVKDCDNIFVLEKGKIVGQGTHEQLKKSNDIYRSIVLSQLGQEGLK